MADQKGFLLVTMEPPPSREEEFNDWYDNEHIPERGSLPGFESARRFVCTDGWPKYLATYDLEDHGVLQRPEYLDTSWKKFGAWTRRAMAPVRGQYRGEGDQIYPGQAPTSAKMARLVLVRFSDLPDVDPKDVVEALRACYEGQPEVIQLRVFRSTYNDQIDYIALVELRLPLLDVRPDIEALGGLADHLDMINEYSPYWIRGHLPGVFS